MINDLDKCPNCGNNDFEASVSAFMSCDGIKDGRLTNWDFYNSDPYEDVNPHVILMIRCANETCDFEDYPDAE